MAMKLSRRTVLKGVGGAAVALPVLECMLDDNGTADAQTRDPMPKRYAIVFAGQAIGGDQVRSPPHRLIKIPPGLPVDCKRMGWQ